MAWDKTRPTNTEKIRDLGTVIRANWDAIEENDSGVAASSLNQWVIHLIDRSTIGGANTPARIDDIGMLYCRSDGTNNELFFQDSQSSANEIQLTEDDKIGAAGTQAVFQDISFGSETSVYTSESMTSHWVSVLANGTTSNSGTGTLTPSYDGTTGNYTITFGTNQADTTYGVHVTVESTTGGVAVNYHTKAVGSFKVKVNGVNAPFTVTVYGGRA